MTLELRQLRYLLALAEQGSLGRAAAVLGMTQPALTRGLKVLEHKVGSTLFERSKRGVTPTDEGRVLIQRAREVVQVADALDRDVIRTHGPRSVQVTLGAGPYPAETIVPAAVATFVAKHPMAQVRVLVRDWDELLQRLRKREIDFFLGETSTLDGEYDLDIEPCAPHPVYFIARRGHPLARRRSVRAADTFAYPFLTLTRSPPRALRPMLAARPTDMSRLGRPFPAVEIAGVAAAKRIALNSDAVVPLTLPCVAEEVGTGMLVLLGTEPWLFVKYGFVTLKDGALTTAAAALRDRLRGAEVALARDEAQLVARHAPNQTA